MTASAQIAGFTSANIAEVEAVTKALRVTLRPEDYGSLGIYSVAGVSGIMAAGLGANAPIFSFRWGDATRFALIKRVTFSAGCDTVSFGVSVAAFSFQLYCVRPFQNSDSSGTSLLPSGNMNKLRTTGMGTTLATDIRMSNTAVLTAGGATRTVDTNPLGSISGGVIAGAGAAMVAPNTALFDVRPGEHPLVLAQNEGVIIQANVPATGTWKFGVKIDWTEITAY